jgi:EAL domain-containing protein (putative c-di-GMP-specific phosphodiesterase class I)
MREIGCEFAQGFFYSHAISGDTILDYLARGSPAP